MNRRNDTSQTDLSAEQSLKALERDCEFEIIPCTSFDFNDSRRFTQIELGTVQASHMSALTQQIPNIIAAGTMAQAYTVRFPQGLPHTLMALHQGGYSTIIRENGLFTGTASLYSLSTQAALMGAFTAISVATGQYFLTQINGEMKLMNKKLDEILAFLHEDKKAELMSEMNFIRYASRHYSAIMSHEQQRIATLCGLQEGRKTAIKDIEFYTHRLENEVRIQAESLDSLNEKKEKAVLYKQSTEFAKQLYVMSGLLEVYYAQNADSTYIKELEEEMTGYLEECDHRIINSFSTLKGQIVGYKSSLKNVEVINRKANDEKKAKLEEEVDILIDHYRNQKSNDLLNAIQFALSGVSKSSEYYLTREGKVFIKA